MILCNTECDSDVAHILKCGFPPKEVYSEHRYNPINTFRDFEVENEKYMDFQEANYNEFFDWAATYRFCIFR